MKKGKKVTAGLIFLILMTVLMTALTGCNKTDKITDTTKNPAIKIGSDNYPPYNFLNEDGMPTGIDVDLATEAFGRMGYKIEIIPISWEQKKKLLENGEIDCIMGCFSMKGRLDDYQWAGPYLYSRQMVAVRKESEINTIQDLEGKKIAVQATTKAEDLFLHKIASDLPQMGQVNCFSTTNELYAALRKNYVDAIAGHEAMLGSLVRDGEDAYRMLDESIYTSELGIAFKKGTHEEVAQELTETLEEMRNEGITEEIVKKYGLDADEILPGGKSK